MADEKIPKVLGLKSRVPLKERARELYMRLFGKRVIRLAARHSDDVKSFCTDRQERYKKLGDLLIGCVWDYGHVRHARDRPFRFPRGCYLESTIPQYPNRRIIEILNPDSLNQKERWGWSNSNGALEQLIAIQNFFSLHRDVDEGASFLLILDFYERGDKVMFRADSRLKQENYLPPSDRPSPECRDICGEYPLAYIDVDNDTAPHDFRRTWIFRGRKV